MEWFRMLVGPDEGASVAQLCVRAVVIFIIGVLYVRIAGRRTFSRATPLDIVVAFVVGSNLSRVMTGKADVVGGIAATLVLVLLHRLLAMATLRWGFLAKALKASPVVLVRDGEVDRKAMVRHGIGQVDLMEGLRMQNIDGIEDVRLATLENSGRISVVPREGGH